MNKRVKSDYPPVRFFLLGGEEYALVPLRLLKVVDDLEELEDELLAARALQEHDPRDAGIPAAVVRAIAGGVHPVRAWREYRGLTQEELARLAGVSTTCLAQVERGAHQPGPSLARALSHALDVPPEVLVDVIADDGKGAHGAADGGR